MFSLEGEFSVFAEGATKGPVFISRSRRCFGYGIRNARVLVPRCRYSNDSSGQSSTILVGTDRRSSAEAKGQYSLILFFCSSERLIENFSRSLIFPIRTIKGF